MKASLRLVFGTRLGTVRILVEMLLSGEDFVDVLEVVSAVEFDCPELPEPVEYPSESRLLDSLCNKLSLVRGKTGNITGEHRGWDKP